MQSPYVERYKEKMQRRRKALVLLLLLLFCIFIASTLFGDSGILVNMQVKSEYEKLRQERDLLARENEQLKEEIKALKTSSRKIESISRTEFGFGRPGEIVFYFPANEQAPIQKFETPQAPANREPSSTF